VPTSNNAGWTNLGNAYASDNGYATAAPAKNATINGRVGGFDFSAIPANATIDTVTVQVEWKVSTTLSNATLGSRLYVNNVAKGTELTNAAEPTADTTQPYTVSGLTRADLVNNLEINVRASRGSSNTAVTMSLDAVSIQVGYTVPGGSASAPTYDDNGNMLTDGSYGNRTFTYDALGRLTGVTGIGTTATYTLDGAGNRLAETVNGVTTSFDLDLSVASPTILSDGTRTYLPGAPNAGYQQGGVWWSAITDQVGSPLQYVSQTGATSTPVHYDPYGAPRPGSANPTGVGYAGEWKNATGLINLRARQYDPVMGRFVGRDTFGGVLGAPQTANRYSYGLNNPYRYTDPSGRFVQALQDDPAMLVSIGLTFTPVGMGYMGLMAITGWDPITGRSLSMVERGLFALPFLGKGAGILAHVFDGSYAFSSIDDAARLATRFGDDVARLGDDGVRLSDDAARVGDDATRIGDDAAGVGDDLGLMSGQARGRPGPATTSSSPVRSSGTPCTHGNCRSSTKPQHIYVIYEHLRDGTVTIHKFGISGGKVTKKGLSYRAERQVSQLKRKPFTPGASDYTSEIIEWAPDRATALEYEQAMVTLHDLDVGFAPLGNKLPLPWDGWPY
jgi:RHS repeat-associated protein